MLKKQKKGKKKTNLKAEAAKAWKLAREAERQEREAREKEDHYWRQAEGPKSRAAKKHEEEANKRAEAAARKAETRLLAQQEEEELHKSLIKETTKSRPKVTAAELQRRREENEASLWRRAEEEEKKRTLALHVDDDYTRMLGAPNNNLDDSIIDASTVEDAIAQMMKYHDKKLEGNLLDAYKVFLEGELEILKEEKPGLTLAQYNYRIFKLWKKSQKGPSPGSLESYFFKKSAKSRKMKHKRHSDDDT
ncbi:hypothetical protein BUALT_Bualt19G0128600 [Buddleja alternifolia]|uniref:Coiled-coil domain-containing protein n=1 Tax=Buddleja alternifolia TaxID=168488 RepID=A0AAV6W196_9LAMI|nr:hypothetical protein BUALT_Bualt19G0128600 [Buddleja alternifolia]